MAVADQKGRDYCRHLTPAEDGPLYDSSTLLLIFVVECLLAGVVAAIAAYKGRSGFGWFFYAALLLPVALIHAIAMSPTDEVRQKQLAASGQLRKCPQCAEYVKSEALQCRYCHAPLVP